MTDRIASIAAEYGVKLIGKSRYPEPGETRAVKTMERILNRQGEAHFRMVMTTLAETENNHACIDESRLWAASDLIRHWRATIEADASAWLAVWDKLPLGELQFLAYQLRGKVPARFALGGMIHERLVRVFGEKAGQGDLFDDRREAAA